MRESEQGAQNVELFSDEIQILFDTTLSVQ